MLNNFVLKNSPVLIKKTIIIVMNDAIDGANNLSKKKNNKFEIKKLKIDILPNL